MEKTKPSIDSAPSRRECSPGKTLPAVEDVRWIQHKAVRERQKVGGGGRG